MAAIHHQDRLRRYLSLHKWLPGTSTIWLHAHPGEVAMMNLEIPYADESAPISNPPRVLMRDGIWLVPQEERPAVREVPPDPVKPEPRDWAVAKQEAANIAKATRAKKIPKPRKAKATKPPRLPEPPKIAPPAKLRVCVDCGKPPVTPKAKRCRACRDQRTRIMHNALRSRKYVPRPRPKGMPRKEYQRAYYQAKRAALLAKTQNA